MTPVEQLSYFRSKSGIIDPNPLLDIFSRLTAAFLASCAAYAQAEYPTLTVVEERTQGDCIASPSAGGEIADIER
jgi:hypothetical protein